MSQFPRALFRAQGTEVIDGDLFTSVVVRDDEQLELHLGVGWHKSPAEAKAAADAPAPEVELTREELERQAQELGIEFSGRIGDKKLAERIAARRAE